jgi:hypothetical protein
VPRTLLCCAALAAFALPLRAEQTITPTETLIRLTIHPAPAPKPALRYTLLPELKEINPGNPIQNYLKCFMEQQKFFFDKESSDRREKLLSVPLAELPAKELQDYGGNALRQADWAARLDNPDWQILPKLKTDGIGLLLPDLQGMRLLAQTLKLRFRIEVALGRFDDALRTAKTMFALSRHLGEHPTLIGDLVAIAVAQVAIGPLDEMLEQPGSPNLYWALTYLPSPLITFEKGIEGERVLIRGEFHDLDDSAPMSEEQIKKLLARYDRLLEVAKIEQKPGEVDPSLRGYVAARVKDEKLVGAARRRLVEGGLPEERVKRFPAEQVILLDEYREYEVRRDEVTKLSPLPTWQALELMNPAAQKKKEPALFADLLVPALYKVRLSQGRLEQRIALLRHVEALRLYAAEHDGKLPAKLTDCTVPLPDDPFTGKPFRYEVNGNTAHLRGTPPPGEQKNPGNNVHYELTMQK